VLPHLAARKALQQALADPDFFVVAPGTAVKLNLDGLADAAERERLRAAWTEKLVANQCKVDPSGKVELAAGSDLGPAVTMEFTQFGGPNITRSTRQIRPCTTWVKILAQGKAAWQTQTRSNPIIVHSRPGESLDQLVQRIEQADYAWLSRVEIPKLVQKSVQAAVAPNPPPQWPRRYPFALPRPPVVALGLGSSLVTAQGFRDIPAQ
jgi:hypothetical protein